MAEEILEGINPTRMELLALKKRENLAVKGHSLLKEKRDALIKEFFDILDRVKGARSDVEKILKEAYEALTLAQIEMGDLAVEKTALSVPFVTLLISPKISLIEFKPSAVPLSDFIRFSDFLKPLSTFLF